ncbi:MAG: amino acid ABC transporter permease, partial [Dialister sp.]|nr:amino acid ABC transporter permease [Dialister sp.]
MSDFKFSIIQEYTPFFLSGTWLTIKLSVIAILCGFLLGLVLALLRISKKKC